MANNMSLDILYYFFNYRIGGRILWQIDAIRLSVVTRDDILESLSAFEHLRGRAPRTHVSYNLIITYSYRD